MIGRTNPFATLLVALLCFCAAIVAGGAGNLLAASATSPPLAASRVLSFGPNSDGRTGLGTSVGQALVATPIVADHLTARITQVSAGGVHTLLLAEDGSVFSFGSNLAGQTGLGTATGITLVAAPIDTGNLSGRTIKQVSAGGQHSLLLTEDGSVFSSGRKEFGFNGGVPLPDNYALVAAPIDMSSLGGRAIEQVSAGSEHSLLLADDGMLFAYGSAEHGRSGLDPSGSDKIARRIDRTDHYGVKFTQVAAGDTHSLVLGENSSAYSFGANAGGQTGLGTTSGITSPFAIDTTNLGGLKVTQVAAGGSFSLLLTEDGRVFSFGSNANGVTGLGTTIGDTTVATPIDTTYLDGLKITKIAAGWQHSLLLAENGRVFAFGWNAGGRTGLAFAADSATTIATPIDTTNLAGWFVTDISAGQSHSVILAIEIPEPGSAALAALAIVSLVGCGRRRW